MRSPIHAYPSSNEQYSQCRSSLEALLLGGLLQEPGSPVRRFCGAPGGDAALAAQHPEKSGEFCLCVRVHASRLMQGSLCVQIQEKELHCAASGRECRLNSTFLISNIYIGTTVRPSTTGLRG